MRDRVIESLRKNPGKLTMSVLAVAAALGTAISPELRDSILAIAVALNGVLFG